MRKPSQFCRMADCNYPEADCTGDCLTPRRRMMLCGPLDFSHLPVPTVSELAERYATVYVLPPAKPGPAPLSVDVVHPDPHIGDPWPLHLCMPSVDHAAPLGPVLRPDYLPVTPPPPPPLAPAPWWRFTWLRR